MGGSTTTVSPWLAIGATADRPAYARALRRVHDRFSAGQDVRGEVRAVVAQSWERSSEHGITATSRAPIRVAEDDVDARWRDHPLHPILPVLRDLLTDATTQSGHMLVISDAEGVLLWIEGHQRVVQATEDMHFVCGSDWSEAGAGTNALGTAIAVDHPVQIFSAEHFSRMVHPWQCSGAPIHDPETGEILGVVDLTGHLRTAHPHTLSLVSAAAGMAEAYLRHALHQRHATLRERYAARTTGRGQPTGLVTAAGTVLAADPQPWFPADLVPPTDGGEVELADGATAIAEPMGDDAFVLWRRPPARAAARPLRLELLTREPAAHAGGRTIPLRRRQAELLTLLALAPRGRTAEQLALELYGEDGKPVTVRAEITRLRKLLGPVVSGRPYRLAVPVVTDLGDAERLVADGAVGEALALCGERLLPESDAPALREARDGLDAGLRRAVLAAEDPALLDAWLATAAGAEDLEAAERLIAVAGPDSPLVPHARARADRLRAASRR